MRFGLRNKTKRNGRRKCINSDLLVILYHTQCLKLSKKQHLIIVINSECHKISLAGVAFPVCVAGAIGCGVKLWCEPSPTALDVYNSKTTLEITYRDSVAVDSVVVWKEE